MHLTSASLLKINGKEIKQAKINGSIVYNKQKYIELEYVESTGTQYIDTDVKASSNIKVEMICDMLAYNNATTLFGAYDGSNSNRYYVFTYQNNEVYFYTGSSGYPYYYEYSMGGKHKWTTARDSSSLKLYKDDNQVLVSGSQTFTTNTSIYAFGLNSNGTITQNSQMKLYSLKMWDNNVLIRDFIPVLDNNLVPCLYDLVEGKYYYNLGTGEFKYRSLSPFNITNSDSNISVVSSAYAGDTITINPTNLGRFVLSFKVNGQTITGDSFTMPAKNVVITDAELSEAYCTPLTYIQSTGTQYINTGFIPNGNTKVVFDYEGFTAPSGVVFGAYTAAGWASRSFGLYFNTPADTSGVWRHYNSNVKLAELERTPTSGEFILDKGNVLYNGNTILTSATLSFTGSSTMYIFTGNGYSSANQKTSYKLKRFKIYDNDVLTKDFVPALDGNNVPCLFDRVGKQFAYNIGSGTFLYETL